MSGKVVDNLGRSSGKIKEGTSGANVTYDTTEKTSNFTAEAGVGYLVDTSSSAITATLPASPNAGDAVAFKDYTASFATNNLTIGRNSEKIQGNSTDSTISTNRASVVCVYVDSTEGWVFVEESNVGDLDATAFVAATGGTVTTSGDFKIHTFNSSGTFEVTNGGNACGSNTVDFLVVAGGAGGAGDWSGGGGAGGYRESFPNPATGGTPVSAQGYPITVGGGGAAGNNSARGTNGGNSVFSSITSAGGGGGGADTQPTGGVGASPSPDGYNDDGSAGGSGGGAAIDGIGGAGNTPPVSPVQGFAGANGVRPNGLQGGGGGGASETGQNQAGGDGRASTITASSVTRGGGGGGARNGSTGAGGAGGGGTGGNYGNCSSAGSANTGGGGGAMNGSNNGNAGGSGVVIIRYQFQ